MKIKTYKLILNLTGFQLTWLFCVFGEYYNFTYIGLFVGIIYLSIFFYLIDNKYTNIKLCLIFSAIGYTFDSLLAFNKLFIINSNIIIGFLPIWFLVLWPCFATLFVYVLTFLKNKPILAFILGAILVPPTYYLGIPLGLANSSNIMISMIIMAFFWGLLLTFYTFYIK